MAMSPCWCILAGRWPSRNTSSNTQKCCTTCRARSHASRAQGKDDMMHTRAAWLRPLPAPIRCGDRTLKTLGDLRTHILALPRERQDYKTWSYAGTLVYQAATGDETIENAAVAFCLARMMDPT